MINAEFYKKEIAEICEGDNGFGVVNGRPQPCKITNCRECEFVDKSATCCTPRTKWLISEYERVRVDWTKVRVDARILVSDDGETGHRRYFSRCLEGNVYAWNSGATSWSSDVTTDRKWKYAKLASRED